MPSALQVLTSPVAPVPCCRRSRDNSSPRLPRRARSTFLLQRRPSDRRDRHCRKNGERKFRADLVDEPAPNVRPTLPTRHFETESSSVPPLRRRSDTSSEKG